MYTRTPNRSQASLLYCLGKHAVLAGMFFVSWVTSPSTAIAIPTEKAEPEITETREIALSFDDAPRPDGGLLTGRLRTHMLIEALNHVEVTGAAFFILTDNITKLEGGAERVSAYQAAGHFLGNHSHTHPSLHASDVETYLADVDVAREILLDYEGVLDWFRYPFLHEGDTEEKRDAVRLGLAERGLQNGYITVDNYDWYMQALVDEAMAEGHPIDLDQLGRTYVEVLTETVEFYDGIARATLGRSPRHVLLLHENDLAALYVDDLVEQLRELGWRIIPITSAYEDEIADVVPSTLFNGQGRVAALAHEAEVAPMLLRHIAEDEAYLRTLFEQRGLVPIQAQNTDN